MSNQSSLSQTGVTSSVRVQGKEGSGAIVLWASLLLLGASVAAFGSQQQRQSVEQSGFRIQAAIYYQGQSQNFVSQVLRSASGQPGSDVAASEVSTTRDRARQVLSSLQQGGTVGDLGIEVPPMPVANQTATRDAQISISAFDQAAAPILATTESLSFLGRSLSEFDRAAQEFAELSSSVAKMPRLSGGAWGSAVSLVLKDLSPGGNALSSSTLLSPSSLPTDQRISLVRQRSNDQLRLYQASASDSSLAASDRALLGSLAKSSASMVAAIDSVLRSRASTAPAMAAISPSLLASQSVLDTSKAVVAASRAARDSSANQWMWVSIVGWLCLLLSAIMLIRQAWQAVDRQHQMMVDGRLGQAVLAANDRLSMKLRRIMTLESRDDQLRDPPDSPNFALTSVINKILEQRNGAASSMEEQGQSLLRSAHEMDALLNQALTAQSEADKIVASSHLNTGFFSANVVESSELLFALRRHMQLIIDQASRVSGLNQGVLWKMDEVRETAQDASKRIKRLGESAQTVSSSSDSIREIVSQAKVLALNLAIEAAQRGEDGRPFADVAKELESLARDLEGSVNDIEFQASAIQEDSRQTVDVMENGVSGIVACSRLSSDATQAVKSLLTNMQEVDQQQDEISASLSLSAKGVLSEQTSLAQALSGIRSQTDRLNAIRERVAAPKYAVQAFRSWLSQLGRDV